MSAIQSQIDQLKANFSHSTQLKAEDNPADFSAYLHLLELNRMDKMLSYLELTGAIAHQPTWAEVKNHLDSEP